MNIINSLNIYTKIFLGLGIFLSLYWILSQVIPIYFFWESLSFGINFLLLGVIGIFIYRINLWKGKDKYKTLLPKFGIGAICFVFFIQILLMLITYNSETYTISKNYISTNKKIIEELGEISSFSILPIGGASIQKNKYGTTGNANIKLIVKGNKAYKYISILLYKEYNSNWKIYTTQN
jgi:hypothetical protein